MSAVNYVLVEDVEVSSDDQVHNSNCPCHLHKLEVKYKIILLS